MFLAGWSSVSGDPLPSETVPVQNKSDAVDVSKSPGTCSEGGRLAGALQEFDGALAADPDNRMAGNNRAICRMYCCNLPAAIQVIADLPDIICWQALVFCAWHSGA